MSGKWSRGILSGLLLGLLAQSPLALAREDGETVEESIVVLQHMHDLLIKRIPQDLFTEAHGVAIFPGVIKVGLVAGVQHGRGVLLIRKENGEWQLPMLIEITGGGIGWQAGAQSTDFVLVFKSRKSVEGLLKGKLTIGADAAAAAGPVGRRVGASTDLKLGSEIYSYSRSRGLFAGVSLDGSVLKIDSAADAAYYRLGRDGKPTSIPEAAVRLVDLVSHDIAAIAAPIAVTAEGEQSAHASGEQMRDATAQTSRRLAAILDDRWKRYLAAPAEVYDRNGHPQNLDAALARFDSVAADERYRQLAASQEFQAAHGAIRNYAHYLSTRPRIQLPPPPGEEAPARR